MKYNKKIVFYFLLSMFLLNFFSTTSVPGRMATKQNNSFTQPTKSNGIEKINAASVDTPIKDDILVVGKSFTITWSGFTCTNVDIWLLLGTSSANYWNTISSSTSNDGSYTWTVDSKQNNKNYNTERIGSGFTVQVGCLDGNYDIATSPYSFKISDPKFTHPSTDEVLTMGTKYSEYIVSGFFSPTITVKLYKGSTNVKTLTTDWNTGPFTWNIPTTLTAGTNYRFKAIGSDTDESLFSNYFTIASASSSSSSSTSTTSSSSSNTGGSNSVKSITGYTVWYVGKSITISWSLSSASYVKIYLYRSSTFIFTITSSTTNDGSYSWKVSTSLTTSSYYWIKIISTSSSTNYVSSTHFSIKSTSSPSSASPSFSTATSSVSPSFSTANNYNSTSTSNFPFFTFAIGFLFISLFVKKRRKIS